MQERTDGERGLSTQEIIEALAERNIEAARKSIYSDIEVLLSAGFDREVRREPCAVYALRTRTLDIEATDEPIVRNANAERQARKWPRETYALQLWR